MGISTGLAGAVLREILGGASIERTFNPPTAWFLGLCISEPNPDGSLGAIGVNGEPDMLGYARLEITNIASEFSEPSSDAARRAFLANTQQWMMEEITGGANTTVQYYFLSNSPTIGTPAWLWGKFDIPRILQADSTLFVNPGAAQFAILPIVV